MERLLETPRRLALPIVATALVVLAAGSIARASEERSRIEPQASTWVAGAPTQVSFYYNPAFYEPGTGIVRVFAPRSVRGDYLYLPSNTWTLHPTVAPDRYPSVMDTRGRRYIQVNRTDIWMLSRGGGEWYSQPITGTPPAGYSQPYATLSIAFDAPRNRVIVLDNFADQLWQISLDGPPEWSLIGPAPNMPQGYFFFYDPIGDRLVNLTLVTTTVRELWTAPLSEAVPTWTSQLIGGNTPVGGGYPVFDVRGYRILDWGGSHFDCTFPPCHTNHPTGARAVNLSGPPVWSEVATTVGSSPHGRNGHSIAYDFMNDRLVVSGGYWHSTLMGDIELFDTWTLELENGAGNLELVPASVDFGEVPGPGTYRQTVEISNVGTAPSVIFTVVSSSPVVTVDATTFALNPGQSRTLTVEWNGPDLSLDATIEIESSDPTGPVRIIPVTGSMPSLVDVDGPDARDFGLAVVGRNPTAGTARLELAMAARGAVEVGVYDLRGSRVRRLAEGVREAGRHPLAWDGLNEAGGRAAAGVYFVRAHTGAAVSQAKVVLTP